MAVILFIPAAHYLVPLFDAAPWLVAVGGDWFQMLAVAGLLALVLLGALLPIYGTARAKAGALETVEMPKWKPITMVTVGIVLFALLLERTGMFPALVALVLIASLGGEEFKTVEVIGNIIVLTILSILVFKVGLGMNISVIEGVW